LDKALLLATAKAASTSHDTPCPASAGNSTYLFPGSFHWQIEPWRPGKKRHKTVLVFLRGERRNMANQSPRSLVWGFIAGAIAVVTVHEIVNFVLLQAGVFPRIPWSMEPAAMTGLPQILADAFWGGLWGILFALIINCIPGRSPAIKGLVFGVVGPAILGVFILVPLITGRFPLFFGGDPKLIVSVLLILAAFGAGMGWLYGLFTRRVA
jgi:hypothetical protein